MNLRPIAHFIAAKVIPTGVVHLPQVNIRVVSAVCVFRLDRESLRRLAGVEELEHWVGDRGDHRRRCGGGVDSVGGAVGVAQQTRDHGLREGGVRVLEGGCVR